MPTPALTSEQLEKTSEVRERLVERLRRDYRTIAEEVRKALGLSIDDENEAVVGFVSQGVWENGKARPRMTALYVRGGRLQEFSLSP